MISQNTIAIALFKSKEKTTEKPSRCAISAFLFADEQKDSDNKWKIIKQIDVLGSKIVDLFIKKSAEKFHFKSEHVTRFHFIVC